MPAIPRFTVAMNKHNDFRSFRTGFHEVPHHRTLRSVNGAEPMCHSYVSESLLVTILVWNRRYKSISPFLRLIIAAHRLRQSLLLSFRRPCCAK